MTLTKQSNKEIATSLAISLRTAEAHVHNIYRKIKVHRRKEVMARDSDLRLITPRTQNCPGMTISV